MQTHAGQDLRRVPIEIAAVEILFRRRERRAALDGAAEGGVIGDRVIRRREQQAAGAVLRPDGSSTMVFAGAPISSSCWATRKRWR